MTTILTVARQLTCASQTAKVLLLLNSGGGGSGNLLLLLLGMRMMRAGLLVHPGRLGALGIELVVSVDVRRGHHVGRDFSLGGLRG